MRDGEASEGGRTTSIGDHKTLGRGSGLRSETSRGAVGKRMVVGVL